MALRPSGDMSRHDQRGKLDADLGSGRVPARYCTLTEETEVIYKVTGAYDKAAERGVIWNDPDIGINWPVAADKLILSDKDKVLPRLADCPAWFHV